MERVLILRRSQPYSQRAVDFSKLLETSLEDKIQEGLSKRLLSRSVVVGKDWAEPRDFDVLLAMVEKPEKGDLLGNTLSLRPKAKPTLASTSEVLKKYRVDAYGKVLQFAREKGKAVIWVGVESTPEMASEISSSHWWREPKVAIREKSLEEDLDKLAQMIENPSDHVLRDILNDTGYLTAKEPEKSAQSYQSSPQFDVFLCHNSGDKPLIRDIAKRLSSKGIRYWFDEEQSQPGTEWQDLLESQIESIQAAAVFVGPSGVGPWHNRELKAFINEFLDRQCKVIPVVLPGVQAVPKLPVFFKGLTWVDFRNKEPDPMKQLIWGITGKRS